MLVHETYVLLLSVLVVTHVVHGLEQRLLFGEIYGCVDYALVSIVFSEIALNMSE